MTLRQRKHAKPPNGEILHSSSPSSKSSNINDPRSSSLHTVVFLLLLLLAAIVAAFLYASTPQGLLKLLYALPEAYALCSPFGQKSIYTVDEFNTRVQCVTVYGSVILDAGDEDTIAQRWKDNWYGVLIHSNRPAPVLPVRYLTNGTIVVPGISDSHGHVLEYGTPLRLEGTVSIADTVARVREYILASPLLRDDRTKWVRGGGWDHTVWSEGWPKASDLETDPVLRGRRILLQSKDYHATWISEKALQESLPIPETVEGGVIERDGNGSPTGCFLDNAQELIKQPGMTDDELFERFSITVQDALSQGLTSLHDAGLDPASLAFFKRQASKGKLPIRLYVMTFFDANGEYWGNTTKKVLGAADGTFTSRSVKIFTDGALRTGGAALYEPYTDNPSTSGFLTLEPEVLSKFIPLFLRDGWQVNVHAIGDRANGIVLDVFEDVLRGQTADVSSLRPRLEHAQIITREDMKRLGKLGVIASIQPTHAIDDMPFAEDRLGPERVKNLYAFQSMLDSGARITFGSDFPVGDLNPLSGFYAAIARITPEGTSTHGPDGWFPEQRLSREVALRAMTIDPAYASFTDSILGSLEPGKRADFVIFSQDFMSVPVQDILKTKVLATVIDGQVKYGDMKAVFEA